MYTGISGGVAVHAHLRNRTEATNFKLLLDIHRSEFIAFQFTLRAKLFLLRKREGGGGRKNRGEKRVCVLFVYTSSKLVSFPYYLSRLALPNTHRNRKRGGLE